MDYEKQDILEWEQQLSEYNLKRLYRQKKIFRNPRYKALQDYRHRGMGGHWYSKEHKSVRKMYQRKFRAKLKKNLYHEAYYCIRPRDYKTYGWITW